MNLSDSIIRRLRFMLPLQALLFFISQSAHADILHLELGAANYGANKGASTRRFRVLEREVDALIEKYGPKGIIYLNDIEADGLKLAVEHLRTYLAEREINEIEIIPLEGDYTEIELPQVKTATLNNPGAPQLPSSVLQKPGMDLKQSNLVISRQLESIAELSEHGLKITSYLGDAPYEPIGLLRTHLNESTLEYSGMQASPYVHPDGQVVEQMPRVYLLFSLKNCHRLLE